jgi:hypothetical protein
MGSLFNPKFKKINWDTEAKLGKVERFGHALQDRLVKTLTYATVYHRVYSELVPEILSLPTPQSRTDYEATTVVAFFLGNDQANDFSR